MLNLRAMEPEGIALVVAFVSINNACSYIDPLWSFPGF